MWDRAAQTGTLHVSYSGASKLIGFPANNVFRDLDQLLEAIAIVEPGKPIHWIQDTANSTELFFVGTEAQISQLLTGH